MSTYCTVLGMYAKISIRIISTTFTEYLHLHEGIPLVKTICSESYGVLIEVFLDVKNIRSVFWRKPCIF